MTFKAAAIQTNVQDDVSANLAAIIPFVRQAGDAGATLICLPENAFQMVDPALGKLPDAWEIAEHPGVAACAELARTYRAQILIGSIPTRQTGEDRLFNTQVLLDDAGQVAAVYHKIHLFDVDLGGGEKYSESKRFAAGHDAVVATTPLGKIGMSICYDVRFPQLYRALAKAGAEILAVPAAFTAITGKAHWHVLNRARAIEHGCFVISAAQTGIHPGNRQTYGHSLIISPWGEVLADGGEGVGVVTALIDTRAVAEARRKIPSLNHDREFSVHA